MTDVAAARADALTFLKANKAGVLATVSREGKPHASAIYYVCDDSFNIYFLTLLSSRKFQALKANPWVAFTVGTQDIPQTVQIEGVAVDLQNEEEINAHFPDLLDVLLSNTVYYAPITQLGKSDVAVTWLQPKWIRWANYGPRPNYADSPLTEIPV